MLLELTQEDSKLKKKDTKDKVVTKDVAKKILLTAL